MSGVIDPLRDLLVMLVASACKLAIDKQGNSNDHWYVLHITTLQCTFDGSNDRKADQVTSTLF